MIEWGLDLDSQTKEVVPFGLEKNTSVFFSDTIWAFPAKLIDFWCRLVLQYWIVIKVIVEWQIRSTSSGIPYQGCQSDDILFIIVVGPLTNLHDPMQIILINHSQRLDHGTSTEREILGTFCHSTLVLHPVQTNIVF